MRRFSPRIRHGGDALISRWMQRGGIKSMQTGAINLNGVLSATATIAAVDLADSIIVYDGYRYSSTTTLSTRFMVRLELTNATTVAADRYESEAVDTEVGFTVVEFYPGVLRSVQRGSIDVNGGTSATATITAVDTTKACVMWLGSKLNATGGSPTSRLTRMALTDATTVTCSLYTNPTVAHVTGFQVVEWW